MQSKDFPGANSTYKAKNLNEKDLRAYVDSQKRVTAWHLTDEDIKQILENRTIFLIEVTPTPGHIKLITENPIPQFLQLKYPTLFDNETNPEKDA